MKIEFFVGIDKTYVDVYHGEGLHDLIQRAVDLAVSHHPVQPSIHQSELLTVREASDLIGVSKSRLYHLLREGIIPSIKYNGVLILLRSSLRKWFKETGRTNITQARKKNEFREQY